MVDYYMQRRTQDFKLEGPKYKKRKIEKLQINIHMVLKWLGVGLDWIVWVELGWLILGGGGGVRFWKRGAQLKERQYIANFFLG